MPLLSIIIPTRNEARHIRDCVGAVRWAAQAGEAEIIVVDNHSADGTADLAREAGARAVACGPERSAQRNRGARDEAAGDYVLFLDADMRLPRATLEEILAALKGAEPPDALFIREEIAGTGFWIAVRNFERSFYDGTCIDGLRVIRRDLFRQAGGYDESLFAGEDWDLDRRVLPLAGRVAITRGALVHHEGDFSLRRYLRKKAYYSTNFDLYCRKWRFDETVRRQFGFGYRFFGVFFERGQWRRSLARPHLLLGVWVLKALVGAVFVFRRREAS